MRKALALAAALALGPGADPLAAQFTDPAAGWLTLRTEHFSIHYPESASEWTLPMARRLESVQAAVERVVGFAPRGRVDLVVTDPLALPNGFAASYLDHPLIQLWPTPPSPRMDIGEHRGWAELLSVHEYTHVAHIARPSRHPVRRAVRRLLPLPTGPLARAPAWVIEGYATYVEGRLTGSGRPHGVWRPAVLRQMALEGRLPSYGGLDSGDSYRGGSMRYLVGSAYLEWLVAGRGEESLRHLWRRMTARVQRTFPQAFSGVFPGEPAELYGRFVAEVTASAVRARDTLRAAGLQAGDTVQRLSWETGDPAVSPDGSHLALVLREGDGDSRLVVWRTADEPVDSAAERRRRRLLERDPEDVPDVAWRPPAKKVVATLHPASGYAHESPRFLPDGRRLLLVRREPNGTEQLVPDLFLWDFRGGGVERVTTGARILSADPAPDGRTAVAVRCELGVCALVSVGLDDGSVRELLPGLAGRTLYRPRVSPDGASAAVAVHEAGRWRVALVDLRAPALRYVGPDDGADRYDAAFAPDGRSLLAVSHRSGVPNVERIDPATGTAVELTRVTGAALAPEPSRADGSVYFLSLHARGLDLNRLPPDAAPVSGRLTLDPALAPAAPAPAAPPADTFAAGPLPEPRGYGAGPRRWLWSVGGTGAPDEYSTRLALISTDPVGRLSVLAQGALATQGGWGGGSLGIGWRGWGPTLRLEGFHAEQEPSRQGSAGELLVPPDLRYSGGVAGFEITRIHRALSQRLRLGGSAGALDAEPGIDGARLLGFAEYGARLRQSVGRLRLTQTLDAHGSAGDTDGERWGRWIAGGTLAAAYGALDLRLEGSHGRVSGGARGFEAFTVGGTEPLLMEPAILSQRVPMPAVPAGVVAGDEVTTARASATPLLGFRPYFWAARAGGGDAGWYRVVGLESRASVESLPLLRMAGITVVTGVAYPLDAPFERDLRFYGYVGYRP